MNQRCTTLLSRITQIIALPAILFAIGVTALAQDPPGRAARLNFLDGSVNFRPAGLDDWAPAEVNLTVSTGDRIWTDRDSRAEFHAGSTAFRMSSQTDLSIVNLNDDTTQLSVSQGALNIRINRLDPSSVFEVDTPNSAITFLRPGSYRINVDPDGDQSQVVVRRGEVDVIAEGSSFTVRKNQLGVVQGTEDISYDIRGIDQPDEWDNWYLERDQHEAELAEQHYVSAEMTGYEDLAGYGSWHNDGPDGAYWVPTTVDAGWAPYSYGHWGWTGPWGWTWVDSSPWGFAPFHYGRWAYIGGAWGWTPGAYVAVPVYAPALVGFVGGAGFVIGGGVGIGWFPLGPHEVFVPGYAVSASYYHNINVTHVNVTGVVDLNVTSRVTYVNRNVRGGVTAVSQRDFASGHIIAGAGVHVSGAAFASAQFTGMHPSVAPTKQAVLGGAVGGHTAMPPSGSLNRQFVAKSTPPPAAPSFASQQKLLQANPGKPLDSKTLGGLSKTQGGTTGSPKFKSATTSTAGGLHPAKPGLTGLKPVGGTGSSTSGTGKSTTSSTGSGSGTKGSSGAGSATGSKGTGAGAGTGKGAASTTGTTKGNTSATGTTKGSTGSTGSNATGGGTGGSKGTTKSTQRSGGDPSTTRKIDPKTPTGATGSGSGSSGTAGSSSSGSSSTGSSTGKGAGTGPTKGTGSGTGSTTKGAGGSAGKGTAKPTPTPDKKKQP
jgi:hypothetical protein